MDKFCPLMVGGGNMYCGTSCIGAECAWWCEFAKDCSIPLIAGMFADSDICKNVFKEEKTNDDGNN